jgi:hypothetical protein
MKFMVNCSLRPEKSRDAFKAFVKNGPAQESWELVQNTWLSNSLSKWARCRAFSC